MGGTSNSLLNYFDYIHNKIHIVSPTRTTTKGTTCYVKQYTYTQQDKNSVMMVKFFLNNILYSVGTQCHFHNLMQKLNCLSRLQKMLIFYSIYDFWCLYFRFYWRSCLHKTIHCTFQQGRLKTAKEMIGTIVVPINTMNNITQSSSVTLSLLHI